MRVKYIFSSRKTWMARSMPTNRHKKAIPKIVTEVIKISDVVLEILDSRFIEKTRNIDVENLIKEHGKKIIYVINKSDLVNKDNLLLEIKNSTLYPYVLISCKSGLGVKELRNRIKIEVKRLNILDEHKKAHIGVVGYPNTGKSSLINILTRKGSARTSAEAGFTKGIQRIKLTKDILILDTPGIIPLDENSTTELKDLKKHAEIGVRTYDKVKNPHFVVSEIMKNHPGLLDSFYKINSENDPQILLEELGRKKNLILKKNKIDLDRTARLILKDWQKGDIREKDNVKKYVMV